MNENWHTDMAGGLSNFKNGESLNKDCLEYAIFMNKWQKKKKKKKREGGWGGYNISTREKTGRDRSDYRGQKIGGSAHYDFTNCEPADITNYNKNKSCSYEEKPRCVQS